MKAATRCENQYVCRLYISIHAAREGGDVIAVYRHIAHMAFQSTPPVKAATLSLKVAAGAKGISIHAAREGGDHWPAQHNL